MIQSALSDDRWQLNGGKGDHDEMYIAQGRLSALRHRHTSTASAIDVVMNPDLAPIRLQSLGRKGFANGFMSSVKVGCPQPWQSTGERIGLEIAEVDSLRLSFRSQPFTIKWRIGSEKFSYTPDRIDCLGVGRFACVEVKAARDVLRCENSARKYGLAADILREVDIDFRFEYTEELIESVRANLVARLMHYRRTPIVPNDMALVDRLSSGGKAHFTFGDMGKAYQDETFAFGKLAALLVRRVVSVDIKSEIQPSSVVVPLIGGGTYHV